MPLFETTSCLTRQVAPSCWYVRSPLTEPEIQTSHLLVRSTGIDETRQQCCCLEAEKQISGTACDSGPSGTTGTTPVPQKAELFQTWSLVPIMLSHGTAESGSAASQWPRPLSSGQLQHGPYVKTYHLPTHTHPLLVMLTDCLTFATLIFSGFPEISPQTITPCPGRHC